MTFDIRNFVSSIPKNWKFIRLNEIADVNAHTLKSNTKLNIIKYIDISSISSGTVSKLKEIKLVEAPSRAKRILSNNNILISTVRPNLKQHVLLEHVEENWIASTGFCVISAHQKETIWYLYAFLTSEIFNDYLVQISDGGTYPTFNPKEISDAIIPWPIEGTIKRINNFVKAIENKIELNRQTNQTLEQIAQALFKSWFVDFAPTRAKIAAIAQGASPAEIETAAMSAISGKTPQQIAKLPTQTQQTLKATAALFPNSLTDSELGEVPEGWEVGILGELITFNPQRTLKKGTWAPYLDMKNVPTKGHLADDVYLREMASGTKFINGDTLLARITPCLENGKTAYVDFLKQNQVGWGSTEFIVMRPKDGRPLSLGYFIARLDSFRLTAIQTMTGSSGRQRADANVLAQQPWINYPKNLLCDFDLIAGGYLSKAKQNGDQNKSLIELRNILLPKLLSGELQT